MFFYPLALKIKSSYNSTVMVTLQPSEKEDLLRIIQQNSHPLFQHPTGEDSKLPMLGPIDAVIFDVYGTLFLSGSGDIGTSQSTRLEEAFIEVLSRYHITIYSSSTGTRCVELFKTLIKTEHRRLQQREGTEYPEVDILEIWQSLLTSLNNEGLIGNLKDLPTIRKIALLFELITNPVWPVSGSKELIETLQNRGVILGIISNAQFFTPLLFDRFFGAEPISLGFQKALLLYSFQEKKAKPSRHLFEKCRDRLKNQYLIEPHRVLYVGNDMLNDMYPSQEVGFKTALFAGDIRSLRLRKEMFKEREITPDAVVTDLLQLLDIISITYRVSQ